MYLSIPFIIFIIITIIVFAKQARESSVEQERYRLNEEHRHQMVLQKIEQEKKERSDLLKLIEATFQCSSQEAEKIYSNLDYHFELKDFRAANTNEERKRIYEDLLPRIEEREKEKREEAEYEKYAEEHLMPIVRSKGYDLTAAEISWNRTDLETKKDIPIEEKLRQLQMRKEYRKKNDLDHAPCDNLKYLYEAISTVYPDPKREFPFIETRSLKTLSTPLEHQRKIINCYNSFFHMGLSAEDISALQTYCSIEEFNRTSYNLKQVFCRCVAAQLFSSSIHEVWFFISDLFFSFPYYSLEDYKKIVLTHLHEFADRDRLTIKENAIHRN